MWLLSTSPKRQAAQSGLISLIATSGSFSAAQNYAVRYMDVRDMKVLPNGDVQDQEEPEFCTPTPTGAESRLGRAPDRI